MIKAIMIGGPNNGQIKELDEAYPQFQIMHRVLERNGTWRTLIIATYRLNPELPSADEPLKYEFEV